MRPSIWSPRLPTDGANAPTPRPSAGSRGDPFGRHPRAESAKQLNHAPGEHATHPGTEPRGPDDRIGRAVGRRAVARARRAPADGYADAGDVKKSRQEYKPPANVAKLIRSIATNRSRSM